MNSFLALRKETSSTIKITFSIVKVIDKTNKHNSIYSEISNELSDFKNDNFQRTIQQISENDIDRDDKKLERRRRELTIAGRMNQQKAKISFKIIIHQERDTLLHVLNQETFYLTLLMSELTRRIFIMNILSLMSTCSLQSI